MRSARISVSWPKRTSKKTIAIIRAIKKRKSKSMGGKIGDKVTASIMERQLGKYNRPVFWRKKELAVG